MALRTGSRMSVGSGKAQMVGHSPAGRMLRPAASTSSRVAIGTVRGPALPLRSSPVARLAAPAAAATPAPQTAQTEQPWYALVANAEFFLNDVQNESLAEQLRERVRLYNEKSVPVDFWLVPNPTWLDAKYAAKGKQVKRPCLALVSTDRIWINFMKLRLDRVLLFELGTVPRGEALQMGAKLPDSFPPPAKWTAPYSPYSAGWWNVFLPKE